jgi:D-arabinose 1-dehydrogenase-like Zn-dependent alcohol dehydrogenase
MVLQQTGIPVNVAACGVPQRPARRHREFTEPKLPIIPGHEIVGRITATSSD